MALRAEEITSIIKKELSGYEEKLKMESVGTVLQVGDGIARVYGLDDCMYMELLEFPNSIFGVALNLERDNVGVIIMGPDT